jgi:hypothetical protein
MKIALEDRYTRVIRKVNSLQDKEDLLLFVCMELEQNMYSR